jgi:hypothetical protein
MDGSGASVGTYTQINATPTGQTVDFRIVAIANDRSVAQATTGDLSADRTTITLAGGGTVTLSNPASTEYMRFFDGTIGGVNQFGVVGQQTLVDDIPADGDATYNGVVSMDVSNEDGIYALTGDARITVNWRSSVETRLDGLSGQKDSQDIGAVAGSITMTNAGFSGTGFSGGTLSTTGGIFQSSDGTPVVNHAGHFFGKNADEVGGVFLIEADDLTVRALFAAE